jgi:hypothetical protein
MPGTSISALQPSCSRAAIVSLPLVFGDLALKRARTLVLLG